MLYIGVSIVVTGMQPWFALDTGSPLAKAFTQPNINLQWAATLISAITVIGVTGTCLTSLFGQPRIFYRMARDGLLPAFFGTVHPTTKVPLWGTLFSGVGAAAIAFLIPLDSLSNMISIGTLFAFTTVCAGVVILRYEKARHPIGVVNPSALGNMTENPTSDNPLQERLLDGDEGFKRYLRHPTFLLGLFLLPCIFFCISLRNTDTWPIWVIIVLGLVCVCPVVMISRLPVSQHNFPKAGHFVCPLVPWLPCMGIFINVYLIASLDFYSYVRIFVWTVVGLTIYFAYGIVHSALGLTPREGA